MDIDDVDIEAYARIMAALCEAGPARADVLARSGLDEDRWTAIDTRWQARLSEALDEDQGDGIVPPLVSAYTAAYAAAQRALGPPISIEQLARVMRLLQASGDLRAALAKASVTLADYVRGAEHWSRRIAEDPALARQFEEALRAG